MSIQIHGYTHTFNLYIHKHTNMMPEAVHKIHIHTCVIIYVSTCIHIHTHIHRMPNEPAPWGHHHHHNKSHTLQADATKSSIARVSYNHVNVRICCTICAQFTCVCVCMCQRWCVCGVLDQIWQTPAPHSKGVLLIHCVCKCM
jgi:hypothetical protein